MKKPPEELNKVVEAIITLTNQTNVNMMLDAVGVSGLTFNREPALCVALSPWDKHPGDFVTWWEMQQFSARAFYTIGYFLENLRCDCVLDCDGTNDGIELARLNMPLPDVLREKVGTVFGIVENNCREIGMSITADTAKDAIQKLSDDGVTYLWLIQEIKSIEGLIRREMSGKLFMYVPPERARYWPTKRDQFIFGEKVHSAFPSTFYDISQSGICLAMGCSTASVLHLMRVLEVGLGALGKVFGVSLDHASWGPAILQMESKIRDMHQDPQWKTLPDCKQQQQFYADVASHFGILKDAWRNHAMHARAKYTDHEAQQIFASVKSFMQKLSEKLSE